MRSFVSCLEASPQEGRQDNGPDTKPLEVEAPVEYLAFRQGSKELFGSLFRALPDKHHAGSATASTAGLAAQKNVFLLKDIESITDSEISDRVVQMEKLIASLIEQTSESIKIPLE